MRLGGHDILFKEKLYWLSWGSYNKKFQGLKITSIGPEKFNESKDTKNTSRWLIFERNKVKNKFVV